MKLYPAITALDEENQSNRENYLCAFLRSICSILSWADCKASCFLEKQPWLKSLDQFQQDSYFSIIQISLINNSLGSLGVAGAITIATRHQQSRLFK